MKIHLLLLFWLLPVCIHAQQDSSAYFIKQLKKKDQPDSVIASLNIKLGDIYAETNPALALSYSRSALQYAERTGSDRLIWSSADNLARNLLLLGSYDSSFNYANQSIQIAQKLQEPSLLFYSLNLLGRIYIVKNYFSKAKKVYDDALQLSLINPSLPRRFLIYNNLGDYYYKTFKFKQSIQILKEGEAIALKSNDQKGIMNIYSNLGRMYAFTGNMDSAQHYIFQALEYFHKNGKIRDEAVISENLGLAYGYFKNNSKMEEWLDKAYNLFKLAGDNIAARDIGVLKAGFYFQLLQLDKCLKELNTAETDALKTKQKTTLAIIYNYKAAIFSLLQDTGNASKFQQMAEQISGGISNPAFDNTSLMIKGIVMSSKLKLSKGDTAIQNTLLAAKKMIPFSILQTSLESISLNKKLVNDNKSELTSIYNTLLSPDSDRLIGKQYYDSLINQPIDSNTSLLFSKQLTELETKYKTKQKDDSIQIQTQLIAFKTRSINNRNYFIVGLVLLAALILVLFLRSRMLAKKINRQYTEIQQLQSELTHRTANFFNSIKGMLAVASATTTDSKTISSLNNRVGTINRLFNTLYSSPSKGKLQFDEMLASICTDFEHSFGSERQIKVYHQCSASISKEEAVPLAFIITELMTNAEKYAFEGKESGEIHVEVTKDNDNRTLHVWDNGKGKDENTKARPGSQGMSIIKSYSKNLGGKTNSWNDNGHHFKMEF